MLSRFAIHPKIKFHSGGYVIDYDQFARTIDMYKAIFHYAGLKQGDSVFFCVLNAKINMLAALMACYEMGACITYLDRRHYIDELVPEFQKRAQHKLVIQDIDEGEQDWQGIRTVYVSSRTIAKLDPALADIVPMRINHRTTPAGIYYTSGTTGEPKQYVHSHELIYFASLLAVKNLYREKNNVLLLQNQNINHVGVLTTIFMPILMTESNIFFMDELDDLAASGLEIDHVNLFEHNKHYLDDFYQYLSADTMILTGGKLLNPDYLNQLLALPHITRVHNIFGCTDICTPLFHTQFSKSDYGKTEDEVRLLQGIDEYEYIIEDGFVTQVKLSIEDEPRTIPDAIKVVGDKYLVVGRSDRVAQSKDGLQYITLFEFDVAFKKFIASQGYKDLYSYHTIRLYNNENYRNQVLIVGTDIEMMSLMGNNMDVLNDFLNMELRASELVGTDSLVFDVMYVKSFEPYSGAVKVNSTKLLELYEKVSGTRVRA